MIPEFREINKYNHKLANQDFFREYPEAYEKIKQAQKYSFLESYQQLLETKPELANEIDPNDASFLKWFVKESGIRKTEWDKDVAKQYHAWFKKNKNKYIIGKTVKKINYQGELPQENTKEARNNMLIDIAYSILTHPDIALDVITPGNFDDLKLADRKAQLLNSNYLLRQFADEYKLVDKEGIVDRKKLIDKILNIDLDSLNDFIKKYAPVRSLLSPENFIYFHEQNMAGAKLIGMYANNTVAQAKFQQSDITIADFNTFTINGNTIKSLHDIISKNGEQISKNCAQTSAASVDNAKDPVLAGLKQNSKTANILGTLLRAGVSIDEAGYLFSIPRIRFIIDQYGELSPNSIEDTLSFILEIDRHTHQNEFYEALRNLKEEVAQTNFTSEFIISHILGFDEHHDHNLALMLTLMLTISETAEMMGEITRNSRADSPNGALGNSLEKVILQKERIGRLRKLASAKESPVKNLNSSWIRPSEGYVHINMSKDQLRDWLLSSKMSKLQAFYTLGIDLPTYMVSGLFLHTNPKVLALTRNILNNRSELLSERSVKEINTALTTYLLSKTKLFGDDSNMSLEEKRSYYLNKFPAKFAKIKEQNPDIASIGAIEKLEVSYGKIKMKRSGRLTPTDREMFMSDFDSLLYHENPIAQKLAVDLLLYSYYNEGLSFGPNSFGNFFSPTFYNAFPELVTVFRTMHENITDEDLLRFKSQLYANIGYYISERSNLRDFDGSEEVIIPTKQVKNKIIGGMSVWSYISSKNGLYVYDSSRSGSEKAVYTLVDELNGWYNANKEVSEMLKDNDSIIVKQKPQQSEEQSEEQSPTDDQDSILDMIARLEGEFDFEDDYSEEEGNQQLEQPLCNKKS